MGNLGSFNPTLYRSLSVDTGGFNYLRDIEIGTNGDLSYPWGYPGFTAGISADNCTGVGSIYGGGFAIAVLTSGNQPGTAPGPITLATREVKATSAKAVRTGATGTKGYLAVDALRRQFCSVGVLQLVLLSFFFAVGGTTLFTSPSQDYISEIAWNDLDNGYGATGGGVSSYWSIPSYQSTEPEFGYTFYNGGSATMRNVPDIAALADPLTGVGVYVKDQGGWVQIGGTSLSCPIWAGYLSTINAAFSYVGMGNLGFFNPALYAVGTVAEGGGFPADYLYDITQGSNGSSNYLYYGYLPGYFNGYGYSNTTGSGSIWGGGFAAPLLTSQAQPGTPPRTFWFNSPVGKRTSIDVTWANSVGATAYLIELTTPGNYGSQIAQTFVTKKTNIKVTDLTPNTSYELVGYSVNASGAYAVAFGFQTLP